jgi:hypothetical protein
MNTAGVVAERRLWKAAASILVMAAIAGCGGGSGGSSTAPIAATVQSLQSVAAVSGQDLQGNQLSYSGLPAVLGTVSVPQ